MLDKLGQLRSMRDKEASAYMRGSFSLVEAIIWEPKIGTGLEPSEGANNKYTGMDKSGE